MDVIKKRGLIIKDMMCVCGLGWCVWVGLVCVGWVGVCGLVCVFFHSWTQCVCACVCKWARESLTVSPSLTHVCVNSRQTKKNPQRAAEREWLTEGASPEPGPTGRPPGARPSNNSSLGPILVINPQVASRTSAHNQWDVAAALKASLSRLSYWLGHLEAFTGPFSAQCSLPVMEALSAVSLLELYRLSLEDSPDPWWGGGRVVAERGSSLTEPCGGEGGW